MIHMDPIVYIFGDPLT